MWSQMRVNFVVIYSHNHWTSLYLTLIMLKMFNSHQPARLQILWGLEKELFYSLMYPKVYILSYRIAILSVKLNWNFCYVYYCITNTSRSMVFFLIPTTRNNFFLIYIVWPYLKATCYFFNKGEWNVFNKEK